MRARDSAIQSKSTITSIQGQVVIQHQCGVVVTQGHGGVGGAHRAAQTQTAWRFCYQATIKRQVVVGSVAQRQAASVQEGGGAADVRVVAHQSQVVSVARGGECSGAQVMGKANGLTRRGVAQHHGSVRFHRCMEGGTVAVGQCQCFQSLGIAYGASDQHAATRPRIQHHRLGVVSDTVECLGEGDVGTCRQCAIVGGVKGCVGRSDDCIVGNVDGVGAAGSHHATAEGTAAQGIGFKVRWRGHAANGTGINRCATVIHFQATGGIQGLAKRDALASEAGRAAGCTTGSDGTTVGLCKIA